MKKNKIKEIGKIPHPNNGGKITGKVAEASNLNFGGPSHDYYTTQGIKGSTTHNIYGVYDLAGGLWELTSAYIGNPTNTNITSLVNADSKYKDVYTARTTSEAQYNSWSTIKGDAIYETSSGYNSDSSYGWDNDMQNASGGIIFQRGGSGSSSWGRQLGIFAFYTGSGGANDNMGFRVVLTGISR